MYKEDDWEYASTRLSGTVVRLKSGLPVNVHDVGRSGANITNYSNGGNERTVPLKDLNVKPVQLGFVNCGDEVSYLVRIPKRNDWRQGMRNNNTTTMYGCGKDGLTKSSIAKTIMGRYPTYALARAISEGGVTVAWHRHWALSGDGKLLYKAKGVVGSLLAGRPVLSPEYSYLSEYLEESM